jgi:hypothetical protein
VGLSRCKKYNNVRLFGSRPTKECNVTGYPVIANVVYKCLLTSVVDEETDLAFQYVDDINSISVVFDMDIETNIQPNKMNSYRDGRNHLYNSISGGAGSLGYKKLK